MATTRNKGGIPRRAAAGRASRNTARGPGRPMGSESFDGREALLASAHQVMLESHGMPPSMNYICERAGINPAMVRYHFGNKHELMIALFESISSTWGPPLQELMALDVSALKKLEIHVRQIVRNYRAYPYVSRLMTELQLNSNAKTQKRLSSSFVDQLLQFYRHAIDEGVRTGLMRPIEPLFLLLSIVGLCEYLFSAQLMLEAGIGLKVTDELEARFVLHTTALILDGVRARPGK